MITFKDRLKAAVLERLKPAFPVALEDLDLAPTPDPKMGDLALTFPFQLAKKLKKAPRAIAQEAAPLLAGIPGVAGTVVAGAGFLNLRLDRSAVLAETLRLAGRTDLAAEEGKIVIEHTNINPNKAAHIGHLRNACLGDTLARCLRYKGEPVEVQNYIDDTGVQVVDVVFGFMELEKRSLEDLERLPGRFDYYCWDLYARVSAYLAGHPEAQARKSEITKRIEHGQDPEYGLSRYVSRRIVRAHLATMARLGIGYDVLPCESTILHLKFWDRAFELLKERRAIYLAAEGDNKGCWVMRLEEDEEREKVIVRSDGTVTYVGKDIAYQLWKFGLLGRDFFYEPFSVENGRTLWISTAAPSNGGAPAFGRATKVYNVIDTRQAYLQKVVVQGLRALKYEAQAAQSVHFSYEMVALSPKSLDELGYAATDEEKERSFLEVSGRKGLGVKADDLLDRLEAKALAEIEKRDPDRPDADRRRTARDIATGALRYFMLKYARNSLIVFDFEEALSFEGETGPYLQYTAVRLAGIFRKLKERFGLGEADIRPPAGGALLIPPGLAEAEAADSWDLILTAASLEEEVLRSIAALELSHLAKFAFLLCQKLNGYYHKYPVLAEQDAGLRSFRLLVLKTVKDQLITALGLMGIQPPERM
ncbi:MAG TPA: arginine--tRNA ligase [Candidatus Aminicenantes bacterium]|nr:arginine--tRNA ligase [Candidatus Aminicenantes bacterium]HRY65368.1 arginine--tRNA ligase [Candidatus Aminicenantes bacterium]HRZ72164.1 arginine--tRNA ligase [Candidatus Aminicenantes bacterium]